MFLLQCQISFNSSPQNFPMDTSKVFFTISYLRKAALEWFKQGILEEDLIKAPTWRDNWAEFSKELQTNFRPANLTGMVEIEL